MEKNKKKNEKYIKQLIDKEKFNYLYQPIYNNKANRYTKFEVLTRLRDDDGYEIEPEIFIKIAEKFDIVYKIDLLALKNACEILLYLKDNNINLERIYVNFSSSTLKIENIVYEIEKYLKCFGVDPSMIGIEVTEFMPIVNIDEFNETINKLMNLGIEISIDDFGKMNSDIHRIIDTKFNCIKLDKSIITRISDENNSGIVIKMLSNLANEMGIVLVAEGIENKYEMNFLKEYGINYFQGFHISRPMSIEEVIKIKSYK
ncbi:EAL domain-containing protein [Clostridium sp. DSM 100503]|uniref:EAL domain-containing protein n=1 Tax=Clostridium sp. DSM 100503 TaxID=2963282 RepID=UPI002149D89C|nr:EAL domain-containing protein [Clostridium sp. DSM 100503]MCR1951322.1 EAL domain-containing protein [Clostridium sp. DSM 100503]